jgi:hypothetical protein
MVCTLEVITGRRNCALPVSILPPCEDEDAALALKMQRVSAQMRFDDCIRHPSFLRQH